MKRLVRKYFLKAILAFAKCDDGLHDWIYSEMEDDESFPNELLNDDIVWQEVDKQIKELIDLLVEKINFPY